MKNHRILFLASLILLCCQSCEEDTIDATEKVKTDQYSAKIGDPTVSGTIKCKMKRSIAERPRDGQECGCSACFGACDCIGSVTVSSSFIELNGDNTLSSFDYIPTVFGIETNGDVVIYISEIVNWSEKEFGVDERVVLRKSEYPELEISSLVINTGVYDFIEHSGVVNHAGTRFRYKGYVVVDATYEL